MTVEDEEETQRINSRYRWSYILMPIPMLAGLMVAAYIYTTKDDRVVCYCVSASHAQVYNKRPLQAVDFEQRQQMPLQQCRLQDESLDAGDGRSQGRVRWFVCTGMSCGPGWETILAE